MNGRRRKTPKNRVESDSWEEVWMTATFRLLWLWMKGWSWSDLKGKDNALFWYGI